ncbi:MAG TPA: copper resistance protein CopC [Candidatus Acidoferrales bacterium]|nr:copper resistance protein CopC [Candidatus Acidoferrales bacterium]
MTRARVAAGALAAIVAVGALAALPLPAAAHALLKSSDPAANSVLETAPDVITMTFTEAPDPTLSRVSVLDATGANHALGQFQPTADPETLRVPIGRLSPGVYTVAWRTVSAVDGHVVGGSFAFGIGVTSAAVASAAAAGSTPAASVQGASTGTVLAHWLLYLGLVVLLGTAFAGAVILREPPGPSLRLVGVGWLLACVGTAALVLCQASDAGVGLGGLVGTSLERSAIARAIPLLLAAFPLAVLARTSRWRRAGLGLVAVLAAAAVLADAATSHAGGDPVPLPSVVIQWLHISLAAVWLGGLAALLAQLRGAVTEARAQAARRFAAWATLGLATVGLTGLARALVEVGTIQALVDTGYGQVVLLKSALLAVVALLGAINHFRNVPRADLRGVRRVGSGELLLGAALLLAASQLGSLEPPARAAAAEAAAPPASLVLSGADYATTVRLRLEISPGVAGFNRFTVGLADYDSGAPVAADRVTLTFQPAGRADVGASDLDLPATGPGRYAGSGANLSIAGPWNISALVERGLESVEVPLQVTIAAPPQPIDISRAPGGPTLYTVHLAGGDTVQVYLDPGTPGHNDFHVTFFDQQGNGLAVTNMAATVASRGGAPQPLLLRFLGPGHRVASLEVGAVPQTFTITATAPDGTSLRAQLDITPGA